MKGHQENKTKIIENLAEKLAQIFVMQIQLQKGRRKKIKKNNKNGN